MRRTGPRPGQRALRRGALVAPALLATAPAERCRPQWLPKMAERLEALVVPALQERAARYRLNQVATRATQQAAAWARWRHQERGAGRRRGRRLHRAGAHGRRRMRQRRHRPVPGRTRAATGARLPTQDGARAADVASGHASGHADHHRRPALLQAAVDIGIAAQCAEAVGLMDRLVAITVEYMNTRKQFGVARWPASRRCATASPT
jgi:hypothetical protein